MIRSSALLAVLTFSLNLGAQAPGYRAHFSTSSDIRSRSTILNDRRSVTVSGRYQGLEQGVVILIADSLSNPLLTKRASTANDEFSLSSPEELGKWNNAEFFFIAPSDLNGLAVVRLSEMGEPAWSKRLSITGEAMIQYGFRSNAKAMGNGNLRVLPSISNRIAHVEMDPWGNIIDQREIAFPDIDNFGNSIDIAPDDNDGAWILAEVGADALMIHIDDAGDLVSSSLIESARPRSLNRCSDGSFLIGAKKDQLPCAIKLDQSGALMWARTYLDEESHLFNSGIVGFQESPEGHFYLSSTMGQLSNVMIETDANGLPTRAWKPISYPYLKYMPYDFHAGRLAISGTSESGFWQVYTVEGVFDCLSDQDCMMKPIEVASFQEDLGQPIPIQLYDSTIHVMAEDLELVFEDQIDEPFDACAIFVGLPESRPESSLALHPAVIQVGQSMTVSHLGNSDAEYVIYNTAGGLEASGKTDHNTLLPPSTLAAGMYLLTLDQPTTAIRNSLRFVVQ